MLLPALNKAREKAYSIECLGTLRNMGQLLNMYAGDHEGNLPPAASNGYWSMKLAPYYGIPVETDATISEVLNGLTRKKIYCKLNAKRNNAKYFNYAMALHSTDNATKYLISMNLDRLKYASETAIVLDAQYVTSYYENKSSKWNLPVPVHDGGKTISVLLADSHVATVRKDWIYAKPEDYVFWTGNK